METGLTKQAIISQLSQSPHGKLTDYVDVGARAAKLEPEFLAHLINWNRIKGQVRDSKVALPVVNLMEPSLHPEFVENALANLAMLGPRELLRAFRFAGTTLPSGKNRLRKVIRQYLRDIESSRGRFNRMAVQHKSTLKELYALTRLKPSPDAKAIIFEGGRPKGTIFEVIANLKNMSPTQAAGEIITRKIPFLIAQGALGKMAKEPDLVLALINQMTPTELVTNTKMLEKLGLKSNSALRGAYEEALKKASTSKANVLKTTRAAEAIDDDDLRQKLQGLQDRQLQSMGPEGNWLVLADRSSSMHESIELARHIAAALAKMVKGKVWLVFFDTSPQTIDVTGLSLDVIKKATEHIRDGGSTSIGCGLRRMLDAKEIIDGIVIISDGEENTAPQFAQTYALYSKFADKQVPVYLYECKGGNNNLTRSMQMAGFDMQVFDLRKGNIDYYAIPDLAQTMRTNRYSLIDEVMSTKLLKLEDVFNVQRKEEATYA